ncbi:hypothetical protein HDU98_008153 [Podochytrium sp. JEL0797]|nr:hypothetical protein HDU98_008153 [Podochytrium sp. JEL0797]
MSKDFLLATTGSGDATTLDILASPPLSSSIRQRNSGSGFANDDAILQTSTVFASTSANATHNRPGPTHLRNSSSPTPGDTCQTDCAICDAPLPQPFETQTVEVGTLKPRFLRELKKMFPLRQFPANARVCTKDLAMLLQTRIESLLDTDQRELGKLQNDAMKNLGEYEQTEQNWQKQFEMGWTIGEKMADGVARFGGSWKFIGALVSFLMTWCLTNVLLGQEFSKASPWDPYPFILLNLFLSMIAALQAPVIMMSQNRQAQLDKLQNDYIAKIILRSENQCRHVNAKLDHLLNDQWRRLLEIQQIQTDLLQMMQYRRNGGMKPEDLTTEESRQTNTATGQSAADIDTSLFTNPNTTPLNPFGIMRGESFSVITPTAISRLPLSAMAAKPVEVHWSVETHPDDHVRCLLAQYFGLEEKETPYDSHFVFEHWHTDGDNFMGIVKDVKVEVKHSSPVVRRVVYDLVFNDPSATLDDVLSGEGTVELRNDMDAKCMELDGRYLRVEIHHKGQNPSVFPNGDLPPRYKSTFVNKREDRITEFWKAKLIKVNFTYSPPHQVAVLSLAEGQRCERMRVDFFPNNTVNHAKVFMRRLDPSILSSEGDVGMISFMKEVVGSRPLDKAWIPVAHALWPENSVPGSNLAADPNGTSGGVVGTGGFGSGDDAIVSGGGEDGEMLMESGLVTVMFKEVLVGPAVYVFLCDETRVAFRGVIV